MNRKGLKVLASILTFVLLFSHFSVIGEVIAESTNASVTGNDNVVFDAYINEEGTLAKVLKIGEENKVYLKVSIKSEGYLKSGTITLNNPNFEVNGNIEANSLVSKVEGNVITLNQINAGSEAQVTLPIKAKEGKKVKESYFYNQNEVKFEGKYVDGSGKEKTITGTSYLGIKWDAERKTELEATFVKLIPYTNSSSKKKIATQMLVKTKLTGNTLPVKNELIEISMPLINSKKAEKVTVSANTTKQINGEELPVSFTKKNYNYSSEENKLTITMENKADSQGYISWEKEAYDEYIVTAIYDAEGIDFTTLEAQNLTLTAKSTLKTTNDTNAWKEIEITRAVNVTEVGKLIEFTSNLDISEINKGKIYENYNAKEKQEIEYTETITPNVTISEFVDKIIIEKTADSYVKADETKAPTTIANNNYAYFKKASVSKEVFDRVLGENGAIKIYNGTALVATINKDSTKDENQNYVVNLAGVNLNALRIETTKPTSEGTLPIKLQKAIKGNNGYTMAQMQEFTKLELKTVGNIENSLGLNNQAETLTKEITLKEPQTKVELSVDKENLSTIVVNQDVKITATLVTNSYDNKLFKDPVLEITMPNNITDVKVKSVEALFGTEVAKLTVKNNKVITNDQNQKVIQVELEGTQTDYTIGAVSKGVNVVIKTDITVNRLSPNAETAFSLKCTNNYISQEEASATANINIVAPTGLVTLASVQEYAEDASMVYGISEETKQAVVKTASIARDAKFNMYVINNNRNTIDNVVILGRTLFVGNKAVEGGADLGSNINVPLKNAIQVTGVDASKVKVYYSTNETPTKDLNNSANGWTLTPGNYTNVKSYMIVLQELTMEVGNYVNFTYDATLPENLKYNQIAYEDFVVYYNNNLTAGTVQEKAQSTKIALTTGKGAVLGASLSSNTNENKELIKGSTVKYTVTVKNTGTETAKAVKVKLNLPTGLSVKDGTSEVTIGDIPANGEAIKEFEILVGVSIEDKDKVETKASITSESISEKVETNSVYSTIIKTYYTTVAKISSDAEVIKEGEEFKYIIKVLASKYDEERENTVLEATLPSELEYQSVKIYNVKGVREQDITENTTTRYNKNSRKLNVELGTVNGADYKQIEITAKVGNIGTNVYSKEVTIPATLTGKDVRKEEVLEKTISLAKVGFKVSQTATITPNASMSAYEDFTYIFEIENLSPISLYDVEIKDILPKELTFSSMVLKRNGKTSKTSYKQAEDSSTSIEIDIDSREKVQVEVNVRANGPTENTRITNLAKLYYAGNEVITSNSVSHTILKFEGKENEVPTIDPSMQDKVSKRISGQVWIEETIDGKKENTENSLSKVEVMLYDNTLGEPVRDASGNILKVTTAEDGTYSFTGVKPGKYTVIFLYDSGEYSATIYKMENVDATRNSDAIDTKIVIDGVQRVAGITEEIVVKNDNIYNIDLGLVRNPKFDLSLNKTVSKITLQDSEGTKTYTYDNTKLAKADIVGKKVNDTTIVVEYKIAIKNEGAISGFAKKIVDYVPASMKFSTELNKDWYTGANGEIYNASLANTIINPGETKEITLILTKKMTENTLGLINNTAEIYEAYNDIGASDVDSTVANKQTNEDDMSSADILITVKTGETILFIGLSVSIIAIIGAGAYFIKKKVLR